MAIMTAISSRAAKSTRRKFTEKIDYIIQKVSETGCKVIVNDMCWNCNSENFYRKELKRLAEATGGLYVSAQDAYGDAMLGNLNDGVHPNPMPPQARRRSDAQPDDRGGGADPVDYHEPTQAPVIGSYARVYDAP